MDIQKLVELLKQAGYAKVTCDGSFINFHEEIDPDEAMKCVRALRKKGN